MIEREQRWLPLLQAQLPLAVPAPLRIGRPDGSYPWFWSIVHWIDGETVDRVQLDEDQGEAFAAFLESLRMKEVQDQLALQGFPGRGSTPAELTELTKVQLQSWAAGPRAAGVQPD